MLKHVVVVSVTILTIPAALVLFAIDIDSYWLFILNAVLVSSCVLPIALAITWHRSVRRRSGARTSAESGDPHRNHLKLFHN